ncbi:hypothetical protein NU10_07585 [Flavobacterium dauae]|uniref:hypothetical protein n=1 Tax=Flavobacterium dauae TaxID=1563479 RepID=UPI00101C2689|nr:hypothetical protein [Flavobacterium dauae]WLD22601.1 hypothetical protein NU10_07585 [Flavobacterium dauae]
MRKLLFFTIVLFFSSIIIPNYSQPLYKQDWGTLIPIYNRTAKPFSSLKTIVRTYFFVAEINPKTGCLYLVNAYGDEIFEYCPDQPIPKLIYKIPNNGEGFSTIESIKFDSDNYLVISGRTANSKLATSGAYSESLIFGESSRPTFISKIDLEGHLMWSTYFHDLVVNASHITIDANNNIYILNKRNKHTVATSSSFQEIGDLSTSLDYQDVISKLDSNGKHIWSTFYTKDSSKIRSIVAGTDGLYIYGEHLGAEPTSNYFGTSNSFQETISDGKSSLKTFSKVFLSKFSFEGKRIWSTYFGVQNTNVTYGNTLKNNHSLVVINDEAYILTSHKKYPFKNQSITTEKAYLREPFGSESPTTISKFSSKGERVWTSYINAGEYMFSDGKDLFISSSPANGNSEKNLPTTENAHQPKHGGGRSDVYISILSSNGTTLKYASFYGYEGQDSGVTLPTQNGFYIIGSSNLNQKVKAPFVTSNIPENEYFKIGEDNYSGDFLSYFTKKELKEKKTKKKKRR